MTSREPKPILEVRRLGVTFANNSGGLEALEEVSFDAAPNDFVCVLGPSGSGKSTLLRVLAGLIQPTRGEVVFTPPGGQGTPPRVGLVFQNANLMPWRTAEGNITLPLELQGVKMDSARSRAGELIELVGLEGFENAWPGDLSGGMAQRVALARALIQEPDLLLLDEPFGALDALTREQMGDELLRIWQARRNTVIMVTHSISEALLLSDRVLVLTARPAVVCLDVAVDLARPREEGTRYSARFGELARMIRGAIAQ